MKREIKFEYGFESVNGTVKKVYDLWQIPKIALICDVWNILPLKYVRICTGVKDGNGIEIYEGDIMQHANPFDIPFLVNWSNDNSGFVFNYGSTSYVLNDTSFTVIGNIYENPEFLDVS